ncbi:MULTISPECIES: 2'-5' RNA ligase family protein [Streptomyces]|uniref:2'-5' RNA ligase family protein n=1 Tax=Streptomyces glycanivorans TaxID=3033808 RepID=A0ABY9JJY9_9ACTN|nr:MULTISPECIES: 2'-5' RNA ligase family protein [unclassified Streptomyces]WSQ81362.1 2'-5' RNA ligase family protein [Streptomyces sp. NBC_01213]TXS10645.1 2'-5' RNA ligase family protein [Streptomyces sp. wa22]WLQ68017.1 2'-5' RNA ligase family protein [Streptomyces sp. Alt3]WSQ88692.1 2'-5' RNA ligase family protein [Streptomyces sp. NBC_01212]WSR05301.1 2'-5' RNA ligase family protein [Streptomyces sp. NBC_01208]
MHSVELLPDRATERAVREAWERLARAGLPSLAAHRHPTNRPHLTLATADTLSAETRALLDDALEAALPLPLALDGLVRFRGRRHVLAWAVRPEDALLRLHRSVWRTLRDAPGSGRPNPLHDPGRWVPHITLGRGGDHSRAVPPEPLPLVPGTPPGVLTGRWTGARSYDSLTRTTGRLGPWTG